MDVDGMKDRMKAWYRRGQEEGNALLVGYGTLMSRASLATTVGDAGHAKAFVPVVVQGYRRLFNLRPDHYEPSLHLTDEPLEAAALNIEPAADLRFNGVALEVTEDELRALDLREPYYRRIRVAAHRFSDAAPLGQVFVYSSDPDQPWICRDPRRLLPRWKDVLLARNGAYGISRSFGEMFDETTYMADGTTLLVEAYRRHLPPPEAPRP